MYNDPFFANFLALALLFLILLTTVIISVGILRFLQLYTHQANHNQAPLIPNALTVPHSDIPLHQVDSNNVALDYIKRNFIANTEF